MNSELKILHRRKQREYVKNNLSDKYKNLSKEFNEKYKIVAEKYINKNVDELMKTNPGNAYYPNMQG